MKKRVSTSECLCTAILLGPCHPGHSWPELKATQTHTEGFFIFLQIRSPRYLTTSAVSIAWWWFIKGVKCSLRSQVCAHLSQLRGVYPLQSCSSPDLQNPNCVSLEVDDIGICQVQYSRNRRGVKKRKPFKDQDHILCTPSPSTTELSAHRWHAVLHQSSRGSTANKLNNAYCCVDSLVFW